MATARPMPRLAPVTSAVPDSNAITGRLPHTRRFRGIDVSAAAHRAHVIDHRQGVIMSFTTIPVPRIRLTKVVPAALLALGLGIGVTAVAVSVDNDSSPAVAVHEHTKAAAPAAPATPAVRVTSKWSASSGMPASPAASEFPADNGNATVGGDTSLRYGPH
jgi:hypothetical protein